MISRLRNALRLSSDGYADGSVTAGVDRIAECFARYFKQWAIRLPDENLARREQGEIKARGWWIRFLFGEDEQGAFLDFHACHRMTNDRHARIYVDGTVKDLPACDDFFTYPANATADQKREAAEEFREHNARVDAELRRKGFRDGST